MFGGEVIDMTQYKYVDFFVNILLSLYNVFSYFMFLINPKLRKALANNRELTQKRNSDECYILGNGPSLSDVDLNLLKEKDTFSVNSFYKHAPGSYHTRFFVAIDTYFSGADEGVSYIDEIYKKYPDMVFILKYNAYKSNPLKWDKTRTFFLYPKLFQVADRVNFDCTKNMTACLNVVLQCIQVAMFMGYKKIYLLGCDFNQYAKLKPEHFYGVEKDRGGNNMGADAKWSAMVHFHHYALHDAAKKRGIDIINLTEGSLIDAYPRDNIDNVLNG